MSAGNNTKVIQAIVFESFYIGCVFFFTPKVMCFVLLLLLNPKRKGDMTLPGTLYERKRKEDIALNEQ